MTQQVMMLRVLRRVMVSPALLMVTVPFLTAWLVMLVAEVLRLMLLPSIPLLVLMVGVLQVMW